MKLQSSNKNNIFEKLRALNSWLAVVALVVCAISFASLLILAPSASAQKATGTITGTVTDPSGAVVPGATVTIVNERTSTARSATTNEQGSFSFPEVDAGTYALTVTKTGFKKQTQKNVELHVADVTNLNVKMEMGAATGEFWNCIPMSPNPSVLTCAFPPASTLAHRVSPLPEPPKLAPIPTTMPQWF